MSKLSSLMGLSVNPINKRKRQPNWYDILREDEIPEKTQKAIKLAKINKTQPGSPLPLFAKPGKGEPAQGFVPGEWTRSIVQRPTLGDGPLAYRPGLHAVGLPIFDQGKVQLKSGPQRIWLDVDMPAVNPKTQLEADTSPFIKGNTKGQRVGVQRPLAPDEAYDYKTNPNASQAAERWPIAGSMKTNRVMSDDEIRDILNSSGMGHYVDKNLAGIDEKAAEEITRQMMEIREAVLQYNNLMGVK
mgnify:CR=1 FL=1